MNVIDAKELRRRLEQSQPIQLVDVRSAGEYASGHIPRASNIPLEQVEDRLDDVAPSGDVVLICQSGRRAGMCFENFHSHRQNLLVLDGGTNAWIEAGGSVIRTQPSSWSIERQVRLAAGLLVLIGSILSLTLSTGWVYLGMIVGAGLSFAAMTNVCGMAAIFAVMPWNRASNTIQPKNPVEASR